MLLHGAAVGRREGGVLLVGRGGSGKSTCAFASLTSDLLLAGDDYVAARAARDPWIFSLYSSGKLVPEHARLLPHLPPPSHSGNGAVDEKSVFHVHDHFPDHTCSGFPLRAVVVPQVSGGKAHVRELDPGSAFRALAPSTLLQLYPARPEAMAAMASLVRKVPTFALEIGPDIGEIPTAIERLLERVS